MGRYLVLFLMLSLPTLSFAGDCVTFTGLLPAFTTDLSLPVKKAKIYFRPLNLAAGAGAAEGAAYLLQDLDSCGMRGDCDSTLYLRTDAKCYRPVLSFRGKWKGLERKAGREFASLRIESRFEGDTARGTGPLRIERRLRSFDYVSSAKRYEETP